MALQSSLLKLKQLVALFVAGFYFFFTFFARKKTDRYKSNAPTHVPTSAAVARRSDSTTAMRAITRWPAVVRIYLSGAVLFLFIYLISKKTKTEKGASGPVSPGAVGTAQFPLARASTRSPYDKPRGCRQAACASPSRQAPRANGDRGRPHAPAARGSVLLSNPTQHANQGSPCLNKALGLATSPSVAATASPPQRDAMAVKCLSSLHALRGAFQEALRVHTELKASGGNAALLETMRQQFADMTVSLGEL